MTGWAVVRYIATAAMAGLAVASEYWPREPWVAISIAVLGTLAIHVVPAVPAVQNRQGQP